MNVNVVQNTPMQGDGGIEGAIETDCEGRSQVILKHDTLKLEIRDIGIIHVAAS